MTAKLLRSAAQASCCPFAFEQLAAVNAEREKWTWYLPHQWRRRRVSKINSKESREVHEWSRG